MAGFGMAWTAYRHADKGYAEPIAVNAAPAYSLLLNKYYVDEGYDYAFTGRRKVGNTRLGVMGLGRRLGPAIVACPAPLNRTTQPAG